MVKIVLISPSPSLPAGVIRASSVARGGGANSTTTRRPREWPASSSRVLPSFPDSHGFARAGLIGTCRISPILRPFQGIKEALNRPYRPSKQSARLKGERSGLSHGTEKEDRIDSDVRQARRGCARGHAEKPLHPSCHPERGHEPGRLCEGGAQASEMVAARVCRPRALRAQ